MSATEAQKWKRAHDPNSNKDYWYHVDTKETSWTIPSELAESGEMDYVASGEKNIALNRYGITATISQRYASVEYQFDFENNDKEDSKLDNELQFDITIDSAAFISEFIVNIDNEIFIGQIKEKHKAKQEYNLAKQARKNAILIFQTHENIPNVFTIKINLNPQSKTSLNITVEQYLTKIQSYTELNIEILNTFHNVQHINIKEVLFTFNIGDISGIYDININSNHNNHLIVFDGKEISKTSARILGKVIYDINDKISELILRYKVIGEQNESNILYDDKKNIFCHIISDIFTDSNVDNINNKPVCDEEGAVNVYQLPRRCVFLVDQSGSMDGMKWNKTIASTIYALRQLDMRYDRFCVMLFNETIEYLTSATLESANKESITLAIKALHEKLQKGPGGCTNINDSLINGMELIKNDIKEAGNCNFYSNQIVFITDGEPNEGETDTNKIILNVAKHNVLSGMDKYSDKISIFSFGIGRDVNDASWVHDMNHLLLKLLSVNNNGFYKRVKQSSTEVALNQYFDILSKPILRNINVSYKGDVESLTNTKFNILYSGNDIIVCGKCKANQNNCLIATISAKTCKKIKQNDGKYSVKPLSIHKEIKLDLNGDIDSTEITDKIERIWAYLKLQEFVKQKLIHNDMIEMDESEIKQDCSVPLSLAMKYKFVTPWTSMIVVKNTDNINKIYSRKTSTGNTDSFEAQQQITYNRQSQLNMAQPSRISSGSVIHFDAAWGSESDGDGDADDSWDEENSDSSSDDDGLDIYDPLKNGALVNDEPSESQEMLVNDHDNKNKKVLIVDTFDGEWKDINKIADCCTYTLHSYALENFDVQKHSSMFKKINVCDLLKYSTYEKLKHSLLKMDKKMDRLSQRVWYFINKYISVLNKNGKALKSVDELLKLVVSTDNNIINDEVFCQLMKQSNCNPSHFSLIQTWQLMAMCCCFVSPSAAFANYLASYLYIKSKEKDVFAKYASFSLKLLAEANSTKRKKLPTKFELIKIKNMQRIPIKLWFLDNTFETLLVSPHVTVKNINETLSKVMKIKYVDSFNIFQMQKTEMHYYEWEKKKDQIFENRKDMNIPQKCADLKILYENGTIPIDKELDVNEKIMDIYSLWIENNNQIEKDNLNLNRLICGYINNKNKDIPSDITLIIMKYYITINKVKEYKFVFKCKLHCKTQQYSYTSNELKLSYLCIKWNIEHILYPLLLPQDIYHLFAMHLQFDQNNKNISPNSNINNWFQHKDEISATHKLLYNEFNNKDLYLKYIEYLNKSKRYSLYYDCTFFNVVQQIPQLCHDQGQRQYDLLLGVSQSGILLIHPINLTIIKYHKLEEILSYGVRSNIFLLFAGTLMTQRKYRFVTIFEKQINDLVQSYIDYKVQCISDPMF